jgi:CheY-like chemotaxis protein
MNGYQAAEAIRKSRNPNNQGIPIFALSASAGIDIKNKVRDFGMDGHISKPFNPAELHQTLERIVFNL